MCGSGAQGRQGGLAWSEDRPGSRTPSFRSCGQADRLSRFSQPPGRFLMTRRSAWGSAVTRVS